MVIQWDLMGYMMVYLAWKTYKKQTGSHGPVEIVDFPINSMVDLSTVFCMFTKG